MKYCKIRVPFVRHKLPTPEKEKCERETNSTSKENKMANGIKYYVITEENLMKLAKLKAAACSSLDGNVSAQRSYLLKECNRPVAPEPFKNQK